MISAIKAVTIRNKAKDIPSPMTLVTGVYSGEKKPRSWMAAISLVRVTEKER
jgi:hypothetical protein